MTNMYVIFAYFKLIYKDTVLDDVTRLRSWYKAGSKVAKLYQLLFDDSKILSDKRKKKQATFYLIAWQLYNLNVEFIKNVFYISEIRRFVIGCCVLLQ